MVVQYNSLRQFNSVGYFTGNTIVGSFDTPIPLRATAMFLTLSFAGGASSRLDQKDAQGNIVFSMTFRDNSNFPTPYPIMHNAVSCTITSDNGGMIYAFTFMEDKFLNL